MDKNRRKIQTNLIPSSTFNFTINFTGECRIEENYSFLKQNCQKINGLFQVIKCEEFDQYYAMFAYNTAEVSSLCFNDQHNYQSCGLKAAQKIGNPVTLCNRIICLKTKYSITQSTSKRSEVFSSELSYEACEIDLEERICLPLSLSHNRTLCQQLANEVAEIGESESQTKQCDMLCQESTDCIDEANCNGFQYGSFCTSYGKMRYISTSMFCNSYTECDDLSDERDCSSEGGVIDFNRGCLTKKGMIVKIMNYTRCGPLWSHEGKYASYCLDFEDQYNCSDPDRGMLRCDKDTFSSTVSVGVLCKNSNAMCDDEIDLKCRQTSEKCLLHKHLLCNYRADCPDGSDENNTECQNLHSSTCHRR